MVCVLGVYSVCGVYVSGDRSPPDDHLATQSTTTTPLHVWEGTMCSHCPIAGAQQLPCPHMYASTAHVYSKQPHTALGNCNYTETAVVDRPNPNHRTWDAPDKANEALSPCCKRHPLTCTPVRPWCTATARKYPQIS